MKLKRFLHPPETADLRPRSLPGERCEFCAEAIAQEHSHVVDLESRSVLCSCRACYLLFTHSGAAGGRYRAVPSRYREARLALTTSQWDQFQIPVALAFFFHNSSAGRTSAFYPSPAGATESLLPLDAWQELVQENPMLADLEPDTEALLVYKRTDSFDAYLVPIDACYQLVGLVRRHWKGFAGGEEAWRNIESFFEGVRGRTEPVAAGRAG